MDAFFSYLSIWMTKFPAYAPFIFILTVLAFILYKAHKSSDNKFTIFDLVMDKETGRGSLDKVGMLAAMLTITWWYVSLASQDKATFQDTLTYGGIMGLSKFASSWISAKYGNQPKTDDKE